MSIVGKSTQYYSGFNPTMIRGCDMWLDAMDSASITMSGSNVVRWNDKSGNTRHAVATGNPQLGTTTTGRQAIVLSGTNYFDVSGADTLSGGSMTIFAQASATTNGSNLMAIWGNTRVITFQLYYNGNIIFFTSNTVFFNSNAMCCIVEDIGSTVASSFFNGRTDNTTTALAKTPNTQFVLGANYNYAAAWIGNIQEVIIYDRALPAGERQQVEGYLGAKWNIRSTIPATHPFKTLTPFGRPFIPTDISQCLLWLDASEPSSLSLSGSNVTTWRDKSGSAKNLTVGPFSSPTYASNGVTFTGTGGLTFSGGLSTFYDIFVVGAPLASTSTWRTLMQVAGGTATHTILVESGSIRLGTWFNAFSQFGSLTWGGSNALLFARLNSNLTMNASMNGTFSLTAPTAAVGAATSSTINIGNANGAGQPWGTVYEFIVYDGALSLGRRQLVETYLVNKWGLRGVTPSNHPTRLITPLSAAFSPLVLSNCAMWLDAADSTSITMSGSNVVRWNDKSGNTRHAVATGNPQLGTTTTGRQAIVLSGVEYFNVSGASTLSGGSSTVFIQASATTNSRNLYNLWANSRSLTFQLYYNGTDNLFFTSNTVFFNSNAMCCIVDDLSSTICSSFFNGRPDNTITARAVTPNTSFILGGNSGGTNPWIGNIQEMIYYNRALQRTERQQVEGYLAGKWGLTPTLIAGHPYKSATP